MVLKRIELFTAVCTIMALMALVAAVPADAAPRQTDVFCDAGTFNRCTDTLILTDESEVFDCEGIPQTDDVTCTSVQTGEMFDCEFVGGFGVGVSDRYFCTEIEEQQQPEQQPEQQPGQQPATGGGGAAPITQDGEQESESGEIDQSFEVS